MKKKIIWTIVIIVVIGGSIAAWYAYSEFERKPETAADKETFAKIDANAIMKEFIEDELKAKANYKEKAIEINGTISELLSDDEDQLGVKFETEFTVLMMDIPVARNVSVTFEPDQKDKVKKLKIGQKITAKGVFSDYDPEGDIQFYRGLIID